MHPKSSAVDEKQRSPLLEFYLSALAFAGALVLTRYSPSPWREILRVAMVAIAGFAVWALIRFLRVADERQRRINFRACASPLSLAWFFLCLGGSYRGSAFFMFPGSVSLGCNSSRGASV
jgi:hypothetical protein